MMVLNAADLANAILEFSDPANENFPVDAQDAAVKWAAAMKAFYQGLSAPTLAPGTLELGETAAVAAIAGLLQPAVPGTGLPALQAGFTAFVATFIAGGVAGGQVVVPPPVPIPIVPGPPTDDPVAPANAIGATALAWSLTGTFTIPPAPAIVPWS